MGESISTSAVSSSRGDQGRMRSAGMPLISSTYSVPKHAPKASTCPWPLRTWAYSVSALPSSSTGSISSAVRSPSSPARRAYSQAASAGARPMTHSAAKQNTFVR